MAEPMSRRPGRPALPDGTVADETLHVRVNPVLYDRVCKIALRINKPVSTVARQMIERDLARVEAWMATQGISA
jgi:predicted transcriptional regulator